jgi:hypothetical protein
MWYSSGRDAAVPEQAALERTWDTATLGKALGTTVFDPIAGEHDRIQDLDVLVEWDASASRDEVQKSIQQLRARSPSLKIRTLEESRLSS